MDKVIELLGKPDAFFAVAGVATILVAIIGRITSSWLQIDLSNLQRIGIATLGATLVAGSFLLGYAGSDSSASSSRTQFKVISAEFPHPSIRIVARINKQSISYPVRFAWAVPQASMHTEDFLVEASDEYTVSISVIAMDENGRKVEFFQSDQIEVITPNQLPVTQTLHLHEKGDSGGGAGPLKGSVTFQLRSRD